MRYCAIFGAIAVFVAGILVFLLATGSVPADFRPDNAKIISIVLGFHQDTIVEESVEIRYGHPPNLGHQNGSLTVKVRAYNGTTMFSFNIWDPRYQFDEYGTRNELVRHEQWGDTGCETINRENGETPHMDLPLIIPYNRDVLAIDLYDRSAGVLLVSVDVSPAKNTFRYRFPRDPDMIADAESKR